MKKIISSALFLSAVLIGVSALPAESFALTSTYSPYTYQYQSHGALDGNIVGTTYGVYDIDVSTLSSMNKGDAVRQLYLTLLHREPELQGWAYWTNMSSDLQSIKNQMMGSIEYTTKIKIAEIYREVLNRDPNDGELSKWTSIVEFSGWDTNVVRTHIGGNVSAVPTMTAITPTMVAIPTTYICPVGYTCVAAKEETSTRVRPITTIEPLRALVQTSVVSSPVTDQMRKDQIRALYRSLLHRDADEGGLDYWFKTGFGIDTVKLQIMVSTEYVAKKKVIDIYNEVLKRNPSDAEITEWYYKVVLNRYNADIVRTGLLTSPPATASQQVSPKPLPGDVLTY